MNQVLEALANDCKIESPARMEGKRMVALLAPKPGGPGEKAAAAPAKPKAEQPKPPPAQGQAPKPTPPAPPKPPGQAPKA
jgi:translation initiation factor IF-3